MIGTLLSKIDIQALSGAVKDDQLAILYPFVKQYLNLDDAVDVLEQ